MKENKDNPPYRLFPNESEKDRQRRHTYRADLSAEDHAKNLAEFLADAYPDNSLRPRQVLERAYKEYPEAWR